MNNEQEQQVAKLFEAISTLSRETEAYKLAISIIQQMIVNRPYDMDMKTLLNCIERAAYDLAKRISE